MNLSGVPRRELVLRYLKARPNQWVPGRQLMNAEVGGARAGGRIHELRQPKYGGYIIEARPSKAAAEYEYRLVVEDVEQQPIWQDVA